MCEILQSTLIYYTFPGQGRCKLIRCHKNKPIFKLHIPKSSMSKIFSSDFYEDGKWVTSLGNTHKLLLCTKNKKNLGVDWCIIKESSLVKNLTSTKLLQLKDKIKDMRPKNFGYASVSIMYEKDGKRYMVRGIRESLKSNNNSYIFTLNLSDILETQRDDMPHKEPSVNNQHFHNCPRYNTDDSIIKQSDLPNCLYLDTWVYKEYAKR